MRLDGHSVYLGKGDCSERVAGVAVQLDSSKQNGERIDDVASLAERGALAVEEKIPVGHPEALDEHNADTGNDLQYYFLSQNWQHRESVGRFQGFVKRLREVCSSHESRAYVEVRRLYCLGLHERHLQTSASLKVPQRKKVLLQSGWCGLLLGLKKDPRLKDASQ